MHFFQKPSLFLFLVLVAFLVVFTVECKKEAKKTNTLDISFNSPMNCDTIYTGDFLKFEAIFSSTKPLNAYSIEIHNDFDQHIHQGTDLNCKQSAKKNSFNPFIYLQLFDIPPFTLDYQASDMINIPESIDTGDYHLFIRLNNVEGYRTNSNISIKILHKP